MGDIIVEKSVHKNVLQQAHARVAKYKLRDKNKTIVSLDIVQILKS